MSRSNPLQDVILVIGQTYNQKVWVAIPAARPLARVSRIGLYKVQRRNSHVQTFTHTRIKYT